LISFATVLGEKVNYKISTTFMDFVHVMAQKLGGQSSRCTVDKLHKKSLLLVLLHIIVLHGRIFRFIATNSRLVGSW